MDGNVVSKMVAREFRVGNDVRSDKLRPIHNFQTGVCIFVDNKRHALGVEEDPGDLAVGVVTLFDSLGHFLL